MQMKTLLRREDIRQLFTNEEAQDTTEGTVGEDIILSIGSDALQPILLESSNI